MLALTSSLALLLGLLPSVKAATCNNDNCYRAFYPTTNTAATVSASIFCRSFTATSVVTPTSLPSRAVTACGTGALKYSSACSCLPTPSPTPTDCPAAGFFGGGGTGQVGNGDFNCDYDIYPWEMFTGKNAKWYLSNTGGSFGPYSFAFEQAGPRAVNAHYPQAQLRQFISGLNPSKKYNLGFWIYMSPSDAGYWQVNVPGSAFARYYSYDLPGAGLLGYHEIPYTVTSTTNDLLFEVFSYLDGSLFMIDNVTFYEV